MSVFNTEKYVGEAIKSILNQSYSDFELIIINDGSIDGSLEIIRKFEKKDYRIKVINNGTNIGTSKSRNKGLRMAQGEFIAIMDSDDICLYDRFEKQVKYLLNNLEVLVLGGQVIKIDSNGNKIPCNWIFPVNVYRWDTLTTTISIPHPCMMIRRDYLLSIGGYPEEYQISEDRALFQKMAINPRFCMRNLSDTLVIYRIHPLGTSVKNKDLQFLNSTIIRKKALEILLGEFIPIEIFNILFYQLPVSISPELSRKSFFLFEKLLWKYKKVFNPSKDEWIYAKSDFFKKSKKLLDRNREFNKFFLARLFIYNPEYFINLAVRKLKSHNFSD